MSRLNTSERLVPANNETISGAGSTPSTSSSSTLLIHLSVALAVVCTLVLGALILVLSALYFATN
jgi:hypothetical protein